MPTPRKHSLVIGAAVLGVFLAFSGLHPFDRTTWALEVFPVVIVLPLLYATHQRFPLTTLLYSLIFFHALVLMLGGTYTYARVPLGSFIADVLDLSRNPYDKIGHFFQGLVPALAAREILLRGNFIQRGRMLVFLVLSVVLAISAAYELLEWASALILGQGADEFLGTQGDPWDTQSDMFLAFIGGSTRSFCFLVGTIIRYRNFTRSAVQPNLSVNRTARKLRLRVPFGLRRPVTSNVSLSSSHFRTSLSSSTQIKTKRQINFFSRRSSREAAGFSFPP